MTQQIAYLEAVIGADITDFRRGMRDVRNDLGVLSDTVAGIGRLGKNLTFAVTAPLVGFGVAAVKAAGSFDAAMRNVNSIAQLGEAQFKALSQRALEFGETIRAGPQAAAEALYTVFSAGVTDPEKAFDVMTVSVKTAEAGLADLNTTVGAVSASVLAYSNVNLTAARAGDILTRTVALGVGEMNNFARALPYVTPAAAAAGIAFEDVGASLAYLTQQGTPANTAARQLNQAIANIVKPSEGMTAALQKLGVQGIDGLLKKYGNLKDALIALKGTTDGSLEGMMKLFGNQLAARAVFGLTNNVDRLNESWAEFMAGIEGATDLARGEQLKSFEAQFDLMKSAAQGLAITIGQLLLPVITPLIQGVTGLLTSVSNLDPNILKLAVTFGAVAAAAGPLLWIISSLFNPFSLLLGASAALAGAIATDWGGIRSSIESAVEHSLPAVNELLGIVRQFFAILFSDEQVMTEGTFYVDTPADSMPIQISGSLWDSWENGLKEQFPDRNQFIEMATRALQEQYGLTPLQIPASGIEIDLAGGFGSGTSDELYMQAMGMNTDPKDITTPLGERLSIAINNALPQLNEAFSNLFAQAKTYLVDTVFPTFDGIGGDLLVKLTGIFASGGDTDGKNPVYSGLRDLFSGGISQAAGEVGTFIEKHFPSISTGLSMLVNQIGLWLINTGIPTVARSVGYFVGRVGAAIGQGLANLPQLLSGTGGEEGLISGVKDVIVDPFQQGFNEAMTDVGVTDPGDSLVTSIAGWVGAILTAKLALSLVTAGVGATFSSILGTFLGGTKVAGTAAGTPLITSIGTFIKSGLTSIAGSLGISMGTLLGGALSIALVAGYVLDEDLRNQINALGESIADALFGEGWTERARANIQSTLTPVLEPILKILANMAATPPPSAEGPVVAGVPGGGNYDVLSSAQMGGTNMYDRGDFLSRLHNPQGTAQNAALDQLMTQMGLVADMSRDADMTMFLPAASTAATAGATAAGEPMANPIQGLINALLPEGPAGAAISQFVADGLTNWQTLQDGTKTRTDAISAGLAAFAASAVENLNPLKLMIDALNAGMTALAGALAMQGVSNAMGATPIQTHAIGGAVHPGFFGMNNEEIFKANVGGSVIPASMVNNMSRDGGSYSETTNHIIINEAVDVNRLLYELRRQGIHLQ